MGVKKEEVEAINQSKKKRKRKRKKNMYNILYMVSVMALYVHLARVCPLQVSLSFSLCFQS